MDPTQKLPPKPFINNTQKILQCISAEVQPSDPSTKRKIPTYTKMPNQGVRPELEMELA